MTTIPSGDYFFDQFITTTPVGFKGHEDADVPDGAIVGDFSTIVNLGIANGPCTTPFPVSATLLEATTSTGGGFVPLSTVAGGDSDDTNVLVAFAALEKHSDANGNSLFDPGEKRYVDTDANGFVTSGDIRFDSVGSSAPGSTVDVPTLAQVIAGLTLQLQGPPSFLPPAVAAAVAAFFGPQIWGAANPDLIAGTPLVGFDVSEKHDETTAANGALDFLEEMYVSADFVVSAGDVRLTPVGGLVTFDEGFVDGPPVGPGPVDGLPDGVTSYPVAVESRLPQPVLGVPTSRYWAQDVVLGTAIEVHTLNYPAGSLGLPAALGDPSVTFFVTGDPGVPQPGNVTDNCSFFTSTFNTLGVSADNPNSAADESGFQVGRNPKDPGLYLFGSFALSQRDLDDDKFANGQDACQFAPNKEDLRQGPLDIPSGDPDGDGIDTNCDPAPAVNNGADIDGDGFLNRLDNCVLVANPTQFETEDLAPGAFGFDGGPKADDIGDACEALGHEGIPDGHYHTSAPTGNSKAICVVGVNCGGAAFVAASCASVTPLTLCNPIPSPPIFFSPVIIGPGHDVRLTNLTPGGEVSGAQTRTYNVKVRNSGDVTDDIEVALRATAVTADCTVAGGAASDTQTATAAGVAPNGQATVSFTVTFDGCTGADTGTAVDYVVEADACHAGDAAPSGFFGAGACPNANDGGTDGNGLNDAPKTRSVNDNTR